MSFHFSWQPFLDPESGLSPYEVCLGVIPGDCSVVNFTKVGPNIEHSFTGLSLRHGESYYATVKGANAIGLTSVATTGATLVDLTPPRLKDSNGESENTTSTPGLNNSASRAGLSDDDISRVRFTCTENLVNAEWPEFEDPESGLQRYEWCVGTSTGTCDTWPLTSTGDHHQAAAIVDRLSSGTDLYATVEAVNRVGLNSRLVSEKCTVISTFPKLTRVIDASRTNRSNTTSDVDWTAMVQSLSLQWDLLEQYHAGVSSMRVQVAFTQPSANMSVPRLLTSRSWYGEKLVHDFMDVLPHERNATIRTVKLETWQRYRGIVRVSNGGDIFTERASDGVRIEPVPPPQRKLWVKDRAAEKEHARWWPHLRIPAVNQSAVDPDVMYVSSPGDLVLEVQGDVNNTNLSASNRFILDHNLFSPTKEFKVSVLRVTSDNNETNTTEEAKEMKTLPGFSNPDGPCCRNNSVDPRTVFSDVHMKPASPVQLFGSSVALLPDGSLVATSTGKVHVLPTGSRSANHQQLLFGSASEVKVAASGRTAAFLSGEEVHVYQTNTNQSIDTSRVVRLSNCKLPVPSCSPQETWADSLEHVIATHDDVIIIRGRISASNVSVVGVFLERNGTWEFGAVLGQSQGEPSFGRSLAVNQQFIVVASGKDQACFSVYSRESLALVKKSCPSGSLSVTAPVSLRLTDTGALVLTSPSAGTVRVLQLDMEQKSYTGVCTHETNNVKYFSGNVDVSLQNGLVVVALGMQTMEGRDGVHLIGFNQVDNARHVSPGNVRRCIDLGRVVARGSGIRIDDGVPRASVSFRDDKVVFGAPGVLTWPDLSERSGTGRVYVTTYCPRDHKRTVTSTPGEVDAITCVPCEEGRRSFGGFASDCSVCESRVCPPPDEDVFRFETNLCDSNSCPSLPSLDNITWGLTTRLENGSFFLSGSEHLYTITLMETTRVDTTTESYAQPFIIDSTPPTPGTVYDGLGSDQNKNCSQNETFGEDSQCSSRDFQDTDVDYTNNTAEVHARWIDFLDNQSDIIEYFWCVGSRPMRDDIRQCESTGLRPNGSHYGLDFQHGDSYFVTVVACNGARRCSAAHSNGVTIDTTPPEVDYVRDGIMGPDMDYQVSRLNRGLSLYVCMRSLEQGIMNGEESLDHLLVSKV